ncbi:hypothetical protein ACFO3A_12695 [Comamonas nitrativorans]|uniref:Lysozyme inhibitor LprI N-terminal domain-containing protein n=1 Tax=Comamonas nitrativorans TaxID=108437 RepID=A0ABV9GZ75_9BURK
MSELLRTIALHLTLLAAGAMAGMAYQSARQAQAHQAQLQTQQEQAEYTAAWLRSERLASESRLHQQIADLSAQLSEAQGKANEDHQDFVGSLRTGTVSVRVPIAPASCPSIGMAPPASATAAAQTAHAQLDPAAAADLAAIPHEGDAAIRELNLCIAQYNQVKAQQDAWQHTLTQQELDHAQTH